MAAQAPLLMLLLLSSSSSSPLLPLASAAKIPSAWGKEIIIKQAGDFIFQAGLEYIFQKPPPPPSLPSNSPPPGRSSSGSHALIRRNGAVYTIDVGIGTQPQPATLLFDVSLDFVWTQCQTCTRCFNQSAPNFDPGKSKTYRKIPCEDSLCQQAPSPSCPADCTYDMEYGTDVWTRGVMAADTFTLGPAGFPNLAFGCGTNNSGFDSIASGILSLGRGNLSLSSQSNVGKFSHCYVSYYEDANAVSSPFMIGDSIGLSASALSTPFVKNPSIYPFSSFYYLKLTGISVGATLVPMPSSVTQVNNSDGTGGLFIDATSPITYLDSPAYKGVRQAFVSQIKLPPATTAPEGLDLCFQLWTNVKNLQLPDVMFHFQGADMKLPPENVFIADPADGLLCLAISNYPGVSVLGNFQLQNVHVLYDLGKQVLSFEPAQCSKL